MSSHVVITCATFAALTIFVATGSQVVPEALRSMVGEGKTNSWLQVAFLLNVAIILFGWRRARDLKEALDAEAEARLHAHESAYSDHTTGLGNRRQLMRALGEACENQVRATLLLLDIDHFRAVNELHGHEAGDEVLRAVADAIREEDRPGGCSARLGNDEFALLIPQGTENVTEIARRIAERVSRPLTIGEATVNVTASIGLAALHPGVLPEEVLRRSDIAMYSAKGNGRSRHAWFDQAMATDLQSRIQREWGNGAGSERRAFVPRAISDFLDMEAGDSVPPASNSEPMPFTEQADMLPRPARRWA